MGGWPGRGWRGSRGPTSPEARWVTGRGSKPLCVCGVRVRVFPEAQDLLRQPMSRVWSCPLVAFSATEVTAVVSQHMVEKFVQGPVTSWGPGCLLGESMGGKACGNLNVPEGTQSLQPLSCGWMPCVPEGSVRRWTGCAGPSRSLSLVSMCLQTGGHVWRPKSVVLPSEVPKRIEDIHREGKPAWAMASQTSRLERTWLIPSRLHTDASSRVMC